jgi:hypothetical protein
VGTVEAAARPVDRSLERRWREAEAAFFATSISDPDLYQTSIALVRGLAEGLREVTSEADLEEAYSDRGPEWAERRLAEIDVPHGDWLDLASASDAAFNLRLTELRSEIATRTTAARLAAARAAGESWLVAVDGEVGFGGQRTYRRVDIHTRIGVALYGYSARDWGRSETYWFEVLQVDPESGGRIRGAPPLRKPRVCGDRAALARAFTAARRRYAQGT